MPSLTSNQSKLLLYCKRNNITPPGYYPDFDERGRWLCKVVVGGKTFDDGNATDEIGEAKDRAAEVALKSLTAVNDASSVVARTPLTAISSISSNLSTFPSVSAYSTSTSAVVRPTPSATSSSPVTVLTATAKKTTAANVASVDRAANVALLHEEFFASLAQAEKLTENVSAYLARASSTKGGKSDEGNRKRDGPALFAKEEEVIEQNAGTDGEISIEGSVLMKSETKIEPTVPPEMSSCKRQKLSKAPSRSPSPIEGTLELIPELGKSRPHAPSEGATELHPDAGSSTAQADTVALQPIPVPRQDGPTKHEAGTGMNTASPESVVELDVCLARPLPADWEPSVFQMALAKRTKCENLVITWTNKKTREVSIKAEKRLIAAILQNKKLVLPTGEEIHFLVKVHEIFRTFTLSDVKTESDKLAAQKVLTKNFGEVVSMTRLQGGELFLVKIKLLKEKAPVTLGNMAFEGTINIKRSHAPPGIGRLFPKDKSCACCWGKGHEVQKCPKIKENRQIFQAAKTAQKMNQCFKRIEKQLEDELDLSSLGTDGRSDEVPNKSAKNLKAELRKGKHKVTQASKPPQKGPQ